MRIGNLQQRKSRNDYNNSSIGNEHSKTRKKDGEQSRLSNRQQRPGSIAIGQQEFDKEKKERTAFLSYFYRFNFSIFILNYNVNCCKFEITPLTRVVELPNNFIERAIQLSSNLFAGVRCSSSDPGIEVVGCSTSACPNAQLFYFCVREPSVTIFKKYKMQLLSNSIRITYIVCIQIPNIQI